MKRLFKIVLPLFLIMSGIPLFAKESSKKSAPEIVFKYPYEYRVIANDITSVKAPYQVDDYVVFTAEKGPRHIGIAFDFEDYKTIHSFMKKNKTDIDDNVSESCYFYILELPENLDSISYKLIIDGIWTTDPSNFETCYNPYTGIEVSTISVRNNHKNETKADEKGAHFVYEGKPGQKIRVGGTFTEWDSWIYELTETRPGHYELFIPLPEGTYYYAYYNGTASFPDKTNPDRAWSGEGRETSILYVK